MWINPVLGLGLRQATIPLGMRKRRGMGWGNITEREVTCSLFPRSLQVEPRCPSILEALSPVTPKHDPCTFEHSDPSSCCVQLREGLPQHVSWGLSWELRTHTLSCFPVQCPAPLSSLHTHTEMRTSTCYGTPAPLQTGSRPSDSRLRTAWPRGAKGSLRRS